jgi:hypothetical protein
VETPSGTMSRTTETQIETLSNKIAAAEADAIAPDFVNTTPYGFFQKFSVKS